MTPESHAMLGGLVLILSLAVGVWAVLARRSAKVAPTLLTIGLTVVMILLGIQILAGLDLLSRGGSPASGVLGIIHIAGPVVAFAAGLWALLGTPRRQIRRYILADHLTFGIALISYAIGEMAKH